jgi:uncharacterized protein with FMN-binding domain
VLRCGSCIPALHRFPLLGREGPLRFRLGKENWSAASTKGTNMSHLPDRGRFNRLVSRTPKIVLSLFVIAASGAYVWDPAGKRSADDLLGPALLSGDAQNSSVQSVPTVAESPAPSQPLTAGASSQTLDPAKNAIALLPSRVSAVTVAANGGYADGSYTGPVADAYYGSVQIQAIVQSSKLASINVLQYPSDRRTSIAINGQALPMLRNEVVAAQSANVDIISGATLTSEAFIQSLGGALKQAIS